MIAAMFIMGGILIITFTAIAFGWLDKTIAALIGAIAAVAVALLLGIYPGPHPYAAVHDFLHHELGVIGVIVGTSIVVAIAADSGLFHFLAMRLVKLTGGRPSLLLPAIMVATVGFVTFLTIAPGVLIMSSLVLVITRALQDDPRPYIVTVADSGIPVFAVLGNHDYTMETPDSLKLPGVARELSKALDEIGISVLQNKAVPLKGKNDGILFLVGIGPHYPGRDHWTKAFENIPEDAPRLVMMHNPESFVNIPPGAAPLALAAHTHGGQIRIPFLPSWSWLSIVREGEIHSDGWIENFGQEGNRLYVNRGIGFSRMPIRLNCRPEVTYFTLRTTK